MCNKVKDINGNVFIHQHLDKERKIIFELPDYPSKENWKEISTFFKDKDFSDQELLFRVSPDKCKWKWKTK